MTGPWGFLPAEPARRPLRRALVVGTADDAFEENDTFATAAAVTTGSYPGLVCQVVGGSFTLAGDARGGATGLILVGGAPASIPAFAGTLLVAPPFAVVSAPLGGLPGVAGAGSLALPVTEPYDLALVGATADMQIFVADAAAPAGYAMSNGLELKIGQ